MSEERTLLWLEGKWWYRLLKVVYILFFVTSVLVSGVIIKDALPHDSYYIDADKTTIKCDSKAVFTLRQASVTDTVLDEKDVYQINEMCLTGSLPSGSFTPFDMPEKLFVVSEVYLKYGSWTNGGEALLFSGATILAAFWLVRGVFFYVVCGKWSLKRVSGT